MLSNAMVRFPLSALEMRQFYASLELMVGAISLGEYQEVLCGKGPDSAPPQQANPDIILEDPEKPGGYVLRLWRSDPISNTWQRFELTLSEEDVNGLLATRGMLEDQFNDPDDSDDDEDNANWVDGSGRFKAMTF
ncbi:hypothetical protein [Novipirellula aureliae]|uniref:hypothetical protein n=1 Tax=Novipirellula aureliae TaxID=2527966 RepID=UPI0011B715E3|nr:hypothetical protein [Novipirellula aureliae]